MAQVVLVDEGCVRHLGPLARRALAGAGHDVLVANPGDAKRRALACLEQGMPVCLVIDAACLGSSLDDVLRRAHVIGFAADGGQRGLVEGLGGQAIDRPFGVARMGLFLGDALRAWMPRATVLA